MVEEKNMCWKGRPCYCLIIFISSSWIKIIFKKAVRRTIAVRGFKALLFPNLGGVPTSKTCWYLDLGMGEMGTWGRKFTYFWLKWDIFTGFPHVIKNLAKEGAIYPQKHADLTLKESLLIYNLYMLVACKWTQAMDGQIWDNIWGLQYWARAINHL